MNPKVVSAIAFKLFGIYVVVSAAVALPAILGAFVAMRTQAGGPHVGPLWPLVMAGATIAIALLAFRILWRLGNGVLTNAGELGVEVAPDVRSFERALFVVLGLFFSISAVVDFPTLAVRLWTRSHTDMGITLPDYAWLLSLVVQLAIGVSLIAKLDKWLSVIRALGAR